jgi:hypothetical protein
MEVGCRVPGGDTIDVIVIISSRCLEGWIGIFVKRVLPTDLFKLDDEVVLALCFACNKVRLFNFVCILGVFANC